MYCGEVKVELPSQDHDSSPRNSLLAGSMLLFGYVLAKEDDIFLDTRGERRGAALELVKM